jgi:hypothetical protein
VKALPLPQPLYLRRVAFQRSLVLHQFLFVIIGHQGQRERHLARFLLEIGIVLQGRLPHKAVFFIRFQVFGPEVELLLDLGPVDVHVVLDQVADVVLLLAEGQRVLERDLVASIWGVFVL